MRRWLLQVDVARANWFPAPERQFALASPHCGMPSRLKDQIGSALSDRIPANIYKTQPFIAGAASWLKEACYGAKTSSRGARAAAEAGDCGACRYRPAAFPRFRQRPGRAPEPASKAQRDLARSTALGRQFGVRVYGKINRGTFDPGGDVGISGMGHAAASDDG